MIKRLVAISMSLGIACATVASALALEGLAAWPDAEESAPQESAPVAKAPGGRTTTTTEVKVFKTAPMKKPREPEVKVLKAAPAPRAAPAKRVAEAAPPVAVAAAPMVGFVGNDGQLQQYMQQFRPILRSEYHVVRVICRLTPEQRKSMARAGEQALRDAAKKYVEMMRRPMTAAQRNALDPRKQIREGLSKAIKSQLPAELAARYQDEIARRDASRKRLAVRNLVARLDRDLILSPEQRDKIGESLSAHWDDSWCQSLEMFMYDYQFLPPIGDQYVAPFLNDAQKKIWRSTQKVLTFWGGFGMMGGIMVDDPLEDEELRVARVEAAKNDPDAPNQGAGMMGGAVMKMQIMEQAQPAQLKVIRKRAQPAEKKATIKAEPTKEMPK